MSLVFLDLETTGLNKYKHDIWEAAWAVEDGPIHTGFVNHTVLNADPYGMAVNWYYNRFDAETDFDFEKMQGVEDALRADLTDNTIVAANPAFDAGFLEHRWQEAPWHHRLLDIEAYAMPALELDKPCGLATIAERLNVVAPDHTAEQDVDTLRKCYVILADYYKSAATIWNKL